MSELSQGTQLFEQAVIRRVWHADEWYYSIVDIVRVLTNSQNPQAYWAKLKQRLGEEEQATELLAAIVQLKLQAADHRFRLTDTTNRAALLRLIQSIPSPRAEPFKQWLAEVGDERIAEIEHPERAIERVRQTYRERGYDDAWIEARIRNDLTRNELTDEWQARGARQGREYAILTNTISDGTFGLSIQTHKTYKLLPKSTNLRDHMTTLELALISLGEATATVLHRNRESQGFPALEHDAQDAGIAAGRARREIEQATGQPAVSSSNHLALLKPGTPPSPTRILDPQEKPAPDVQQHSLFDEEPG